MEATISSSSMRGEINAAEVQRAARELSVEGHSQLENCDSDYFRNDESIERRLFAYIEQHADEIQLPQARSHSDRS